MPSPVLKDDSGAGPRTAIGAINPVRHYPRKILQCLQIVWVGAGMFLSISICHRNKCQIKELLERCAGFGSLDVRVSYIHTTIVALQDLWFKMLLNFLAIYNIFVEVGALRTGSLQEGFNGLLLRHCRS